MQGSEFQGSVVFRVSVNGSLNNIDRWTRLSLGKQCLGKQRQSKLLDLVKHVGGWARTSRCSCAGVEKILSQRSGMISLKPVAKARDCLLMRSFM